MKKMITTIPMILILVVAFSGCSKKKKLNLEKFQAVCAKVAKCDKKFQEIAMMKGGDSAKTCQESLARLEKNKKGAAFVPAIVSCLNESKCETLSMSNCLSKSVTGMTHP